MTSSRPTIVLAHGALTDASVWHGVIAELQASGYTRWLRLCRCGASPPTSIISKAF